MSVSYRTAFIAFVALQLLYFGRTFFCGEVIFPHNNDVEMLVSGHGTVQRVANRKFSDASSVYIPEIHQHLNGKNVTWISTWNPHVQMGRPCFQRSGFSKSYLISNILALFTTDAFVFYTLYTVLTVFLYGTFCFLFLKSLDLHPVACLLVATGISMGPFVSYWLTFVQFISGRCWTLCLLWLITIVFAKRSFAAVLGIAFAVYSLLSTGYPQQVVAHSYIIVGYTLALLWKSDDRESIKAGIIGTIIVGGLFGALSALPAHIDLVVAAKHSARLQTDHGFFLAVMPKISSAHDLGVFFGQIFDAFWFGNPILPHYPYVFNGSCLTPLYFSLFLVSFFDGQWRRLWPWQVFVIVCLLCTIWPPAYLFAVDYLGFHLSRGQLIGAALIPAFVLAGYGADHLIRHGIEKRYPASLVISVPVIIMTTVAVPANYALNPFYVSLCGLIILSIVFIIIYGRYVQPVLFLLATMTVFAYGFNLQLIRPLSHIKVSSPLVETVQKEAAGYRYAKIGNDLEGVIPPNQEILLGLNSPFSYDSLSSRNYQNVVTEFSERGTQTFGRWFGTIHSDSKLDGEAFTYTGVHVLVSRRPLNTKTFVKTAEVDGVLIYKRTIPPVLQAQIPDFSDNSGKIRIEGPLDDQVRLRIDPVKSYDDYMSFKLTSSDRKTLLFLSQQYHPFWKASSNGLALQTVRVNDFYLGVIIPPNAENVSLAFRPYVLWSWIPQLVFVMLTIYLWLCGHHPQFPHGLANHTRCQSSCPNQD